MKPYNIYRSLAKKGPWTEHLTSLPKRGVGVLLTVSAFNHERAPTSCLQRLEALEANKCTQNNLQRNHQRLRSRVLTAHNTPNGTISDGEHSIVCGAHCRHPSTQRCFVLNFGAVLYDISYLRYSSGICIARGRASKTPREARSRVGAYSSKLWSFTRNWAKSRGWVLFHEWALFRETMVTLKLTMGLKRHYARTKFHPILKGSCCFCVGLILNDQLQNGTGFLASFPGHSLPGFISQLWR